MAKTTETTVETTVETTPKTVEELEALLAAKNKEIESLNAALAKKPAVPQLVNDRPDDLRRRVSIRLPINSSDKEPLFVRFGDETFTIKRGVDVSIPYYVWLHLQECQQADDATANRLAGLTATFADSAEHYRI